MALVTNVVRGRSPERLFLLVHGYGADENDLAGLLPYLDPDGRFVTVLPRGPVAAPPGFAWYDIGGITGDADGPLFRRIWRLPPPRVPRGAKRKPVADRYRIGTSPIDTDSIALIVKNCTGLAGFDTASFAGHSLRRGAISSGVAAGVHIARLKQFSGHASLKSLEEYVELDELRQIFRGF